MITKLKGTRDLNPKDAAIIELIRSVFMQHTKWFNFNYIETPIIENSQLYKRSVAGSDIVKKEMYEFKDKGERDVALRPEGTAGFVRALIEEKWYATLKTPKFAYFGPMFRYEQPQKGRQRQFYQAGVEYIGDANEYIDAELIQMAQNILKVLDVSTILKINSIGDSKSRQNYQKILKEYFLKYKDQLSELSQERLENNVLRILDDKIESKKDFVKKAPKINQYLSEKSKKYFNNLLRILDEIGVKYQIDYSLVRGLDYYDEVVYEFVSQSKNAGSQATVIGGGRYSNLINELGGPKVSSSGWGFGIDRTAEIISEENIEINNNDIEKIDIFISSTNKNNKTKLFGLANELRSYGIKIEFNKEVQKTKKIFDKAKKHGSNFVIFDDEMIGKNMFVAKHINSNDKINFTLTEDGFYDLLDFLSSNGIEQLLDIDE
ncbi:histidine--tRNA ligase [Mycoplasmopsis lipofaciens]|uniref:histidine--tRNA ligase n=1 Tax=Mycoplasmopsis lipofaciens TaxID=114884 RepID=UPI0004878ED9|nr:histidine--tRNA ligase [Mycoplasmopsis lipofaciens]